MSASPYEPGDHFTFGDDADFVTVSVLSRSNAADYWDGNWLSCEVAVQAGGFLGRFNANLRTDELERFYNEMHKLHKTLGGAATLATTEEQLRMELEGDGRGHILCRGRAQDVAGTGNVLQFEFTRDQTFLFSTVVNLGELLNRFPVRGTPDK